jgi:hypothetical protein
MTLTEFLLARVAEDEEWARWVGAAQDSERSRGVAFVSSLGSSSVTSAGRVLAECEAKRRIVGLATLPERQSFSSPWVDALMALALPYADHPDYREEWTP